MTVSPAVLGLSGHISRTVAGGHLSRDEMREAIGVVMDGEATHAQVSALLVALRVKGETVDEIVGAAQAMRSRALAVRTRRRPLVDVCGTGGDGSNTFNISTAVALVVAGAGVAVAKHGNRAMSSRCGSADVLEALGVDLVAAAEHAEETLERHGIAFLFAQRHHPAMRAVAPIRREIGIRTLFNLLGPLTNPACATHQVVGVAEVRATVLVAGALRALGTTRAAVVRADDGMDEVSLSCATRVIECTPIGERTYTIEPETFGLERRPAGSLEGGDPKHNAALIAGVLRGARGAHRDVVLINSALALHVAQAAASLQAGVAIAAASIDSGAAARALRALVDVRP